MPYSKKAKYIHYRRKQPDEFINTSFRDVPISHVKHTKKYPAGTRAVVGKLKATGKYATQTILVPKRKSKR